MRYLETLCSTTEVNRGKPQPDVFLETARRMSIAPESAIVVEDSVTGLQAANAAGMPCIVCPDSFLPAPREALGTAALIVRSLAEVTIEKIQQLTIGE